MTDNTTPLATQVAHPTNAAVRTALQSVAGVVLTAASVIATLAILAPQFLVAVQDILPPEWAAYAAGAVAFIGTLSGVVARLMAIPGVNEWLTQIKLGATPKVEPKHSA